MCVSDREMMIPHWFDSNKIFTNYERCCSQARDAKLCIRAHPFYDGTPGPTAAPPPKYFVEHSTGRCVSDQEKDKPEWETSFDSHQRCCLMATSDPEACLEAALMTEDASSSPRPTPAPGARYYFRDSDGICVDANIVPMTYTRQTFRDYDKCCQQSVSSWQEEFLEACLAARPSLTPTLSPSYRPSTPWPTEVWICPDAYDTSTVYASGSLVEVNQVVYKCTLGPFCNQEKFQPPLEDPYGTDSTAELWPDAWERQYRCIYPPSAPPSSVPEVVYESTACETKWHPGDINRKVCTNNPVYPAWFDDEPFKTTYFTDTARECCDKFYGKGERCRIKEDC